MEGLFQSFAAVTQPGVILSIFIGVAGGTVLGALPGLTATMGVALLVPFTFGMELINSMGMLLGIFLGAMYGGSIPAILIRTPGTPAAAATAMDGYPMGQRGEAGRALSMSLISSVSGSFIGVAVMIFLSPQISKFALKFSSAEFFSLAVFGLSIIIAISGNSISKGLMAAFFGLLLSTIGSDPINGLPRFIFGRMELYEGPPFIPTLIGLFAVSEVLAGAEKIISAKKINAKVDRILPARKDFIKCFPTIVKSGLIGCFIGAIPGAGGDIAAFVAYGEAKRSSKTPEDFGHGAIEGVAAPEAANNGCAGGAMIPLLSLGVPGDAVTAILLGALTMQGLQPGPLMYLEHLPDVHNIFAAMIIGCFCVFIVGALGMKVFARVISIDKKLLLPCIMILSLVGSYSMRNNIVDVYITIIFGIIGYLFQKYHYPLSPILLALILGPMAERNLRRYLVISSGNFDFFYTRPICTVLLLAAVASLIISVLNQRKIARNLAKAEAEGRYNNEFENDDGTQ
ncbi:MAG: tripartite tricarboxylate transporter permease [Eubacteriales bacterium]|jgi:putative tricarboxylic transport membrane protein|nr:tripartite tricarboxylate transporter permease [Eubacteriales bacterium]MDD3864542.1 tripartite tricarboxylate transporter permease [Eubacteriales bacterium]